MSKKYFKFLSSWSGHVRSCIRKEDIADFGDQGFLLYNVLSMDENQSIITEAEKIGFNKVKGLKDTVRSAQRIAIDSSDLADILFERIKDYLNPIVFTEDADPKSQHIHGLLSVLKGTWKPSGLNQNLRLCRYYPGGHFAPHYDGSYVKNSIERSMKTFMLYLNDEFQDGCTNFIQTGQSLYKDESGKYCAKEENILHRIRPHPGMAILFNHHRLHEGQQVRDGIKYILRSDVMYKKCDGEEINTDEEKAL